MHVAPLCCEWWNQKEVCVVDDPQLLPHQPQLTHQVVYLWVAGDRMIKTHRPHTASHGSIRPSPCFWWFSAGISAPSWTQLPTKWPWCATCRTARLNRPGSHREAPSRVLLWQRPPTRCWAGANANCQNERGTFVVRTRSPFLQTAKPSATSAKTVSLN